MTSRGDSVENIMKNLEKLVEDTVQGRLTVAELSQELREIPADCIQEFKQRLESRQSTQSELPKALASSNSIPSSVLATAPHLAILFQVPPLDEHLLKTWRLRQAFSSEQAIDPVIDLMQRQPLLDLLPRSLWKKIIQDDFVDFERLYGSTDINYSSQQDDEYLEFGDGYFLMKKEELPAKKPIRTEAEWTRVFTAWETAVLLLYPHRREELQNYRYKIVDMFRATPRNASIAIQFDIETRGRYATSLHHLDRRRA